LLRFDTSKRPARNYFSRREQWRLLLLVMALGVVIFVMRQVREPENVARVAQVLAGDEVPNTDAGKTASESAPPKIGTDSFQTVPSAAPENKNGSVDDESTVSTGGHKLDELLSLAGWTPERFAEFTDGEPLSDAERDELMQLLWRVRTLGNAILANVGDDQTMRRGAILQLRGKVKKVERHELPPEDATQFELAAYYSCDVELEDNRGIASVVTAAAPSRWQELQALDEPVSLSGLYVKQLPEKIAEEGASLPVYLVVAKRIAWHPETPREPVVSLGMSILGSLGMDVGLLDHVRSHGPLHSGNAADAPRSNDEREAFYQMLDAAGQIGANQLIRFANSNRDTVRDLWMHEMKEARDANRRALAQAVVERANAGRYSVAPLFNDAARQMGQLIVVDGAARRVVRVDVGSSAADHKPSDVARRFGIDHYYEMQVFTDDSQNYPLVFCVRELPSGLSIGDDLHVPVRVAGFFFKDWRYTTRGTRDLGGGEPVRRNGKQQYAPLLIGRAPILLQVEDEGRGTAQLVGGGLFLLALGGIWAAAWWLSRGDRRFAERRRQAAHSLPPGQSLHDLNVSAADEPIKVGEEMRVRDER
jgi:hypothetical protein